MEEIETTCPFVAGQRVQTHPATDAWMMGQRYGTVERVGRDPRCKPLVVFVRMDASGRLQRFRSFNLLPAD
jgi:hypothetical protein